MADTSNPITKLGNRKNAAPKTKVGAPVDFPGMVLPNPRGIKPTLDTDIKPGRGARLSGGGRFSIQNWRGNPTGNTSNGRQLGPDIQMREQ